MHLLCAVVVVGLALLGHRGIVAGATVPDGNTLLEDCTAFVRPSETAASAFSRGWCLGYIMGIVEDVRNRGICFPKGSNIGQMVRIVVRYLEVHPAKLHLPAWDIVIEALHDAWPCPPATSQPQR
jgi:hypothetical protein